MPYAGTLASRRHFQPINWQIVRGARLGGPPTALSIVFSASFPRTPEFSNILSMKLPAMRINLRLYAPVEIGTDVTFLDPGWVGMTMGA